MGYKETYNRWLTSDVVDDDTKAELKSIENNEKEIEERFYRELEFGTAGMRNTFFQTVRTPQKQVFLLVTIHVIFHAHLLKKQLRFLLVQV